MIDTLAADVDELRANLAAGAVQSREFTAQIRATPAADDAPATGRQFDGQAVPWDEEITLWPGLREKIAAGAVEGHDGQLWYRHREPIGRLDGSAGPTHWDISAEISDTSLGRDAATLVRDGVISKLSIGFSPLEWTMTEHRDADTGENYTLVEYSKIWIREVSLVPHPAYTNTSVSKLRHHLNPIPTPPERSTLMDPDQNPDLAGLQTAAANLERRMSLLETGQQIPTGPAVSQYRTAGELLKALVSGSDEAREEYETVMARAFAGTTVADDVDAPTWARDLVRLVDEASGPLAQIFATSPLPPEGMTVDGVKLNSNTITVAKQAAEGDDLTFGKVSLTSASWPVETFGGYTSLSRQVIDRSRTGIVDAHLRALAIAAGRYKAAKLRSFYAGVVTAQVTAANTVTLSASKTWTDWLLVLIDAVDKFADQGLSLDALVVPKATMQEFVQFTGSDGRPMMTVDGSGANTVGTLDLTTVDAIGGRLASLRIAYAPKSTAQPAFVNRDAIRSFESPLARLQDDNIVNLSREFSVYSYAALADEIPAGIVPVVQGV